MGRRPARRPLQPGRALPREQNRGVRRWIWHLVRGAAALDWLYGDAFGNALGEFTGVADPTGTNGNLSVDPAFVVFTDDGDLGDDDLHLGPGSACIDAGAPAPAFDDLDGSRNDLGALGGPYGE